MWIRWKSVWVCWWSVLSKDSGNAPESFWTHVWRLVQCWNALGSHCLTYLAKEGWGFECVCLVFSRLRMGNVFRCRKHKFDQFCPTAFRRITTNYSGTHWKKLGSPQICRRAGPLQFSRVCKPLFQFGCWWRYHKAQRSHWNGQKRDG